MRKLNYYILFILINAIVFTTSAQKKNKKQNSLAISGAALLNNQRVGNYSMSVYFDGTRIDSIYSDSKLPIKFVLPCNQVYTFLFQKQNCLDKIVIVNTQIPSSLKKWKDNVFDFSVEMSSSLSKITKDNENYRVAVLMIASNNSLLEASTSSDGHQKSKVVIDIYENLFPVSKKYK